MNFTKKLATIKNDLATVVDQMNRRGAYDVAIMAQAALMSVELLYHQESVDFDLLDWYWDIEA